MMNLVDTGAKYTLIHGNLQNFSGLLRAIGYYKGQIVMAETSLRYYKLGILPHENMRF